MNFEMSTTKGALMKRNPIRQGDVLLMPVSKVPAAARQRGQRQQRIVLAEGETTGHAHVLEADTLEELFLPGDIAELDRRFVQVTGSAVVTHQEHDNLTVPPGAYEVIGQVEHTPQQLRPVTD